VLGEVTIRKLLGAMCLFVLSGILVAGLWPFHAPKNNVNWLTDGNGLLFGEHGSMATFGAFVVNASQEASSCSLEIWLQPNLDDSGTFLAFYWPEQTVVPFRLWQSHSYLGIQHTSLDLLHHAQRTKIYGADVFRRGEPVFITISSGAAGTTVYRDGKVARQAPDLKLSTEDFTGQLVLGNGPMGANPWSGQLKGLAVYDRELTASEASQHYANWTTNAQTGLAKDTGLVALYLFNEGKGSVVHNQVDSATDLFIPKRFFVLHQQFLESPWSEFRATWSYWKNVGINVGGFVPFGFFFCWYFSSRRIGRARTVTVFLGFVVSLTIEVLQSFLPTRDSGMTDILTNTAGTALGVMLFRWIAAQPWLVGIGMSVGSSVEERREELQLVE
jgi:VanZ like family/Concanavalin A-like lectin/glucanases superfamily